MEFLVNYLIIWYAWMVFLLIMLALKVLPVKVSVIPVLTSLNASFMEEMLLQNLPVLIITVILMRKGWI